MRIKGKFCIKELKSFLIALGWAFAAGLIVYGFFALLSSISWALAWTVISIALAPVVFWIMQYLQEEITITDNHETEESSIRIEDEW